MKVLWSYLWGYFERPSFCTTEWHDLQVARGWFRSHWVPKISLTQRFWKPASVLELRHVPTKCPIDFTRALASNFLPRNGNWKDSRHQLSTRAYLVSLHRLHRYRYMRVPTYTCPIDFSFFRPCSDVLIPMTHKRGCLTQILTQKMAVGSKGGFIDALLSLCLQLAGQNFPVSNYNETTC